MKLIIDNLISSSYYQNIPIEQYIYDANALNLDKITSSFELDKRMSISEFKKLLNKLDQLPGYDDLKKFLHDFDSRKIAPIYIDSYVSCRSSSQDQPSTIIIHFRTIQGSEEEYRCFH